MSLPADRPIRILSLLGQYPTDELERRSAAVRAAAPPGAEVEFRRIEGNVYRKGLTEFHRALVAPLVVEQVVAAEQDGCHAAVPYGTLDLGVEESRHAVDIPVVGPGRAAVHTARVIGHRYAIVCYDVPHAIMYRKLLRVWGGASAEITSIRPVNVPITEMVARRDELRKRFLAEARAALDTEAAEFILPLGLTMVPVLLDPHELAVELGVPVLDPLAISMHLAAQLARSGVTNSRRAYPPASI